MGGTKKLSKFIVDWENGTRVAVTDRVTINELNTSIATGPLYVRTEFEAI